MSTTQMRLCFAPKDHRCGSNDDHFLTLAFQQGKVLSMEDFACQWQNNGAEQFSGYDVRAIEVYETCWEMCPHCEYEVELLTEWRMQYCPVCGRAIAPCNLCYPYTNDCSNCPLDKECRKDDKDYEGKVDNYHKFVRRLKEQIALAERDRYDERNALDLRAHRTPFNPVNDIEIFSLDQFKEVWDFVKDSEEWYVDIYENYIGENYAEFTDCAVASWGVQLNN